MIMPLMMLIVGFLGFVPLSGAHRSLPASIQSSEEAAEVFAILSRAGGPSSERERSAGLESIFACVYSLARRISHSDRMPLTRSEFAELLVDLAESVEFFRNTPLAQCGAGRAASSDSTENLDDAGLNFTEEAQTDPSTVVGQELLEQLYAQPDHQERVDFVEKLLEMSDKLEAFVLALFNSVSVVVVGSIDSIQNHLVNTITGAANFLGVDSVTDALEKIEDAGVAALNAAGVLVSQITDEIEIDGGQVIHSVQDSASLAAEKNDEQALVAEVEEEIKEAEDATNEAFIESGEGSSDTSDDESRSGDVVVAPLNSQEALLIRAVLNFDQQEVLARSILVQPNYSAEVNVGFEAFVNSLCHQIKRAGAQDKVGKYVRSLCLAGSDAKRQEKLYMLLEDEQQAREVCDEVVATAAGLVAEQALTSLVSLKESLKAVAASLVQ